MAKSVDPRVFEFAKWWMEQNKEAIAPRDFDDTVTMLAEDIQTACEDVIDEDYQDINYRSLERWRERRAEAEEHRRKGLR